MGLLEWVQRAPRVGLWRALNRPPGVCWRASWRGLNGPLGGLSTTVQTMKIGECSSEGFDAILRLLLARASPDFGSSSKGSKLDAQFIHLFERGPNRKKS